MKLFCKRQENQIDIIFSNYYSNVHLALCLIKRKQLYIFKVTVILLTLKKYALKCTQQGVNQGVCRHMSFHVTLLKGYLAHIRGTREDFR